MMPAVGCGRKAQPQVPKAVGRDLLTLDPQRGRRPRATDKPSPPDHGGTGLPNADPVAIL